ncbi:MAG: hypothetical protein K0R67_79 [Paenibacillus sp.]|nr:hypothetical protein [Paenibacillus sp.]
MIEEDTKGNSRAELAYVTAPVATLWTQPSLSRPLDECSLHSLSGIRQWIEAMSTADKLWLVGKLETQALFGQTVSILEERGDWVYAAVHGQLTSKHKMGYPGWMPRQQLNLMQGHELEIMNGRSAAVVKRPTAWLYEDDALHNPFLEISFNTRLNIALSGSLEDMCADVLPVAVHDQSIRYIRKTDVVVRREDVTAQSYNESLVNGEAVVQISKQFLGLPYLWSGVSGFGYDCSGFTHSMYKFHSVSIPRDASEQIQAGVAVERDALMPGDLIFFAYEEGHGRVHHVAMYAGDGLMLHAPNTGRSIELLPLESPVYSEEYAGARRYI